MGILDKFKKQEKAIQPEKQELPYDIKFSSLPDGRLQIDFNDKKAEFRQMYDTTRLIIGKNNSDIYGNIVESALVSWYGKTDPIMIGRDGREIGRRVEYENIIAGIDINRLQIDYNYCVAVMRDLLNKERVKRYLSDGLKEDAQIKCGNYIGEIAQRQNEYRKVFKENVGQVIHESDFMKEKRAERQKQLEEAKQKRIKDIEEQMEELRNEMAELYR